VFSSQVNGRFTAFGKHDKLLHTDTGGAIGACEAKTTTGLVEALILEQHVGRERGFWKARGHKGREIVKKGERNDNKAR